MDAHIELWRNAAADIVRILWGGALPTPASLLLLAVGFLTCVTAMALVGRALRKENMTWSRALIACTAGGVLVATGVVALQVYVLPHVAIGLDPRTVVLIAIGVLTLVIGVPIQSGLVRASYGECLVALLLALVAAGAMMYFAQRLTGLLQHEKVELGNVRKEQSRYVERALDEFQPK